MKMASRRQCSSQPQLCDVHVSVLRELLPCSYEWQLQYRPLHDGRGFAVRVMQSIRLLRLLRIAFDLVVLFITFPTCKLETAKRMLSHLHIDRIHDLTSSRLEV